MPTLVQKFNPMRGKIVLLLLMMGTVVFMSCGKKSQKEIDDELIVNYIAENNLEAIKTDSGLYYQIIAEGNGVSPTMVDQVSVYYTGRLLNGKIFDHTQEGEPVVFSLGEVILGWQEGLQLMHEGGQALLIVPSHLGYGNRPVGDIPANSVLVFTVELLNIE
ncbi:MAG: peptidylprolyl isomerase [Bacteroidetes bacterium]|nr:MAG: peptidylprolyl isomerase [Bacteroidota bacterium]PIE88434.1 MAG: peptidylprolyl isomerase [Bacteroidota bacterium]